MINVAFIEDDPAMRLGLQEAIRLHPDISCLLAANSIEQFWNTMPERAVPNIIFVDIDLPGQSGIHALPRLARHYPHADLVMLTHHDEGEILLKAFQNGASGYLLKGFPWLEIRNHIHLIIQGGAAISPKMARHIVNFLKPPALSAPIESLLSPREIQILHSFSLGNSYPETASALGVSVDGIKFHVKNIYRKLNVDNRFDAVKVFKNNQ